MSDPAPNADCDRGLTEVVKGMVRLAENYGYRLGWSHLLDACVGVAPAQAVSRATHELVEDGVLEITATGLRFALKPAPLNSVTPPEEGNDQ